MEDMQEHTRQPDPGIKQSNIDVWFQTLNTKGGHTLSDQFTKRFGVSFRNLMVRGRSTEDRFFADFLMAPVALLRAIIYPSGVKTTILNGIDGLVEKGEMLLVLGRPGSGCSTLLKTLALETRGLYLDPESKLNYEGISSQTLKTQLRGSCMYSAETDVHFPELTVAETLLFSSKSRTPLQTAKSSHSETLSNLRDDVISMFHLDQASDTKVGDDVQRGISGGEKRRVSIAEALTGWSSLQCWDNSTRGMDSSTALAIMKVLRSYATHQRATVIATLYQTPEPILALFDKVLVLYEGREIFFGSKPSAVAYFTRLGFERPPKMTTADFLTSLTNPAEASRLVRMGFRHPPQTVDDFVRLWEQSNESKELSRSIIGFEQANPVQNLEGKNIWRRSSYISSPLEQIKLCVHRATKRTLSNIALPISFVIGNAIMALIVGSVFYNLDNTASSVSARGILLFFAALLNAFMTSFEILSIWASRKIIEKQNAYNFYHPSADSISSLLCDIPNKIVTSLVFNICLYFMTNLRRTASAFFIYMLFSLVGMMTMSMFFRCSGSLARTPVQIMVPFGLTCIVFITYNGFVVPADYMLSWLKWIRYLNPISYIFESMMINEFRGRRFECTDFVPSGPDYTNVDDSQRICLSVGAVRGETTVYGDNYIADTFQFYESHLWRNLGILFLFMAVLLAIHLIASEFILAKKPRGEVLLFAPNRSSRKMLRKEPDEETNSRTMNENHEDAAEEPQKMLRGLQSSQGTIHWSNLSYYINVDKKERQLLNEVNGWIRPGRLTALMGATGAGKTTLLDVLSQRTATGNLVGEIYFNNEPRGTDFQRKTGYVQQNDLHCPNSTVRESLRFSAMMRQPPQASVQEKFHYVEEIIQVLGLTSISDAMVGEPGQGLNVEQRKRLSIGVELAARPELLILDEPTSGLDSQTAWTICSLLQTLAHHGQAVICTIHQPSSVIFSMFDELLLIANGGNTMYFGDIGTDSQAVISYFERHGATPCREGENPAEWLFEVTKGDAVIHYAEEWKTSNELSSARNYLTQMKTVTAASTTTTDQIMPDFDDKAIAPANAESLKFATGFRYQFKILLEREMMSYWRTPSYLWAKLAFCCGAALIISISCSNATRSLQGIQTLLFGIFLLFTNFTNLMQQILPMFAARRALFEGRERQSKTYSWSTFLLASIVGEAVWHTIGSILAYLLFYFPIGMYSSGAHEDAGLMLLYMWLFFLFTVTMSFFLIAGVDQTDTAVNIGMLVFNLILIFCGVLATKDELPGFWIFMYRVSPLTYLIAGMIAVGVGNGPISCSETEMLHLAPPSNVTCGDYLGPYIDYAGGAVAIPDARDVCAYCPLSNISEFLGRFNIDYADRWFYFGIVWVFIFFNIASTFAVYRIFRVPKGQQLRVSEGERRIAVDTGN